MPNTQSILEKKNGTKESTFLTSDYTTKLQTSIQYGTGTKKQKYRPMEQKRKSRNKPMNLGVPYF